MPFYKEDYSIIYNLFRLHYINVVQSEYKVYCLPNNFASGIFKIYRQNSIRICNAP